MARYTYIAPTNSAQPHSERNKFPVRVKNDEKALLGVGFNMPVLISTASVFLDPKRPVSTKKEICVRGLFDTGASRTSIDTRLIEKLELIPLGSTPSHTAAGPRLANKYVVDLYFPNTRLSGFINIPVTCSNLTSFNPEGDLTNDPRNFGVLLGRDIMSKWHVTWNGPTSTVIVSD